MEGAQRARHDLVLDILGRLAGAVARVDRGDLAVGDVLGLGLGDADLRLELGRVGHAGEIAARLDLGADFDGQGGEHAAHGGADLERIELLVAELREGAQALDYLDYLAQPENLSKLASAIGGVPGLTDADSDLGILTASYEEFVQPGDLPLQPYFDRVYLPNGIWDTMVTTTDGVLTGQMSPEEATAQMKSSYDSLR